MPKERQKVLMVAIRIHAHRDPKGVCRLITLERLDALSKSPLRM